MTSRRHLVQRTTASALSAITRHAPKESAPGARKGLVEKARSALGVRVESGPVVMSAHAVMVPGLSEEAGPHAADRRAAMTTSRARQR